ncbi:MAG: Crp/Fnr family transcriptional regulator [Methylobacteriaceae bacterium]|nr:Crp/Fnr family transcriptional regulator [Methylobacteriaceae bacterium]
MRENDSALDRHRGNALLSALPGPSLAALEPHLTLTTLERGRIVQESGEPVREALFPQRGTISLLGLTRDGRAAEAAIVGPDGFVGFWAVLGSESTSLTRALVQMPGAASRISVDALNAAAEADPALRDILLRFTKVLLKQALQTIACNALHPIAARCARWLLVAHDRQGRDRDQIDITQASLALMTGVSRQTLSTATRAFQDRRLFRIERGRVVVLDRAGLEAVACECYGTLLLAREAILPASARGAS